MVLTFSSPSIEPMTFSQSLPPVSLLHRCSTTREIQQFHAQSIKTGLFDTNPSIPTKIIQQCCSYHNSYFPNSNELDYTRSVFDRFYRTDHSSSFFYNTLIRAHNQINQPEEALLLFYYMLYEPTPFLFDKFTFPFILKSCTQLSAMEEGEQIHCLILKTQFATDLFTQNSLIHMYSRCQKMESAYRVFEEISNKNVVSWNSMINGFAKSGDVQSARRLFNEMPDRNIVSWNSMIGGYVLNSMFNEALHFFHELQKSGLNPDELTFVSVIASVSDLGLLGFGRMVHSYLVRHGFSLDGALGVGLIDMYSKCGSHNTCLQVFKNIPNKNVGHWTSMIVGLSIHGFAESALELFLQMQTSGVKPNHITFLGVLGACSHGGLLEEGIKHFNLMSTVYDIKPKIQHYGCLVDLLSRSGYLKEAMAIVENMPMEPGVVIWSTLLAACRNHGNIDMAEIVAEKLRELAPDYGGCYVLLSNIYSSSGRTEDFSRIRRMMEERGVEKTPGFSWIEVDGQVHEFVAGDKFHPKRREMYKMLKEMELHVRSAG